MVGCIVNRSKFMARGGKGLGVGDITVLNNSHLDDEDREVQFYIHGNYDLWWHQSQIDFFALDAIFQFLSPLW